MVCSKKPNAFIGDVFRAHVADKRSNIKAADWVVAAIHALGKLPDAMITRKSRSGLWRRGLYGGDQRVKTPRCARFWGWQNFSSQGLRYCRQAF